MTKQEIMTAVMEAVTRVKNENPMAGSVTNSVTMNFVANAQLAVGGSAAMVFLPDEGECLVAAGNAVYCNCGTLMPVSGETIPATIKAAQAAGKTAVLDPVGLGIGSLRTEILQKVKPYQPKLIRGNASEIIALAGLWELKNQEYTNNIRGVDSTETVDEAAEAAVALARYTGGAVAISGVVDLVTDGRTILRAYGGSEMMTRVTGCGCSLGGVCAIYACVADPFIAAVTATLIYNLAGKRAEEKVQGPGAFYSRFLDELYLASAEDVAGAAFELEEIIG